jgi:hypothetical protein
LLTTFIMKKGHEQKRGKQTEPAPAASSGAADRLGAALLIVQIGQEWILQHK